MVLHQDYKELLRLLNENQVEYLVIGAFALGFHGAPRNTGDIDIWIRISKENAKRMIATLEVFGFSSLGFKEEDFLEKDSIIQLGVPPVRIDILTSITGVEFEDAYNNRCILKSDGISINYLSKEDFIKNKKTSGRLKDLADIERILQIAEL
ncbi:MAG: DUF6036 family nucleotidyltransferase [Melioribacteraceae bacterium]|jgi:hypothetical protein|nr:DUF6036 family nucleotidyltransferase [Melioribacteraceae bacterium]